MSPQQPKPFHLCTLRFAEKIRPLFMQAGYHMEHHLNPLFDPAETGTLSPFWRVSCEPQKIGNTNRWHIPSRSAFYYPYYHNFEIRQQQDPSAEWVFCKVASLRYLEPKEDATEKERERYDASVRLDAAINKLAKWYLET